MATTFPILRGIIGSESGQSDWDCAEPPGGETPRSGCPRAVLGEKERKAGENRATFCVFVRPIRFQGATATREITIEPRLAAPQSKIAGFRTAGRTSARLSKSIDASATVLPQLLQSIPGTRLCAQPARQLSRVTDDRGRCVRGWR